MLDRVTITGADDNTSIAEMRDLSAEFLFLELSAAMHDDFTYPISMHVCGAWARGLMDEVAGWGELPELANYVGRMQVNGQATDFKCQLPSWPSSTLQLIFQYPRGHEAMTAARSRNYDAAILFDRSGGNGILPDAWPEPLPGIYCGYAGGLGPDNVAAEVGKIQRICSEPFWIDMEGRMRDEHDRLDMGKVRRMLELCAPMAEAAIAKAEAL